MESQATHHKLRRLDYAAERYADCRAKFPKVSIARSILSVQGSPQLSRIKFLYLCFAEKIGPGAMLTCSCIALRCNSSEFTDLGSSIQRARPPCGLVTLVPSGKYQIGRE